MKVEEKVEKFFAQFPLRSVPKGQILIYVDEDPKGIFYIKKGKVRQYIINNREEEVVVNNFHKNAFVPMSWVIINKKNHYFFETTEPTAYHMAPKDKVKDFLEKNPDVVYDLLGRVYSGLEGILMRMVNLMNGSARSRLMYELIIQARRLKLDDYSSEVVLVLKEVELAKICGLSKETISRELKYLKETQLATYTYDGIKIPSLKKLEIELDKQTIL